MDWLGSGRLHHLGPSPAGHTTFRYASLRVTGGGHSRNRSKGYRVIAERQDSVDRRLQQDVRYVALRKEILIGERQRDDENDEGEIDAVLPRDPLRDFGSVDPLSFGGRLFR